MVGPDDGDLSLARDDRAVTIKNGPAVGTLLLFAVLLAAGLGAGVLFNEEQDTGPPALNFSYQYVDANSALIVTISSGDNVTAGNITLTDGNRTATWATLAGYNNSTMVGPGESVQLSDRNAFGANVFQNQGIRILWVGGNETRELGRWPNNDTSGF